MRWRAEPSCLTDFGFGVAFLAVLVSVGFLSLFLVALPSLLGIHGSLARSAMPSPDPGRWGLEVEVVRLIAGRNEAGPQRPWDEADIQKFVASFSTGLSEAEELELARVIHEECKAYGFAPRFVLSVIAIESSFINRSVSSKGAMGLMQLRPSVAKSMAEEVNLPWDGDEILYQPNVNVRLGMRYLFRLILRYRDLTMALNAYNMGPTRLERMLRRAKEPPHRYVTKVIGLYGAL